MAVAQASPEANLDPPPPTPVHRLGEQVFDTVAEIGDVGEFSILTLIWIFRRRPRWSVLVPIFYAIGVQSVSVVAITGTFIGMVLAVQAYHSFQMMGLATRLGSVINISIVKELGPVLAATMLAGRIGSSMAAELGTMRVTEQIDALACLGVNPIHFGIIMVVNMEVGMCHPPVGLNLYVASGVTKMGITELTIAVWPWLLSMLAFLMLVTYWPGLSIWFPHQLGMM